MPKVKRTERGWSGHYILSDQCSFRRNTLLEFGDSAIVVSTVGDCNIDGKQKELGLDGRTYETMAFPAIQMGEYWDADVSMGEFLPHGKNRLYGTEEDHPGIDNDANEMHESAVREFSMRMENGERLNRE